MFRHLLKLILKKILYNPVNNYLRKNKIIIIFRKGKAIGDHVYMSSIIKKIHEKKKFKIILFTNYYEFYVNSPRIYKLFKIKEKNVIWFFLNILRSNLVLEFRSIFLDKNGKHFLYYHKPKKIHLAQAMSNHFNLDIDFNNFENEIFFSKEEIESYENNIQLPNEFALIQSSAKSSYTKNKEWKFDGMQAVVNYFNKVNWIQIGQKNEPKLLNCTYLLDLNFRELSYVISKCKFLVTYEGLFNHIASCFNKKNFLIHLGFLPIEAFNYKNNILVERNEYLKCYPCFDLNCEYHKNLISNHLDEQFVIKSIEKNL